MSNPSVLACNDCKEYICIDHIDAVAWSKVHLLHNVSLSLENVVGDWAGAFDGWKAAKPHDKASS